MAIESLSEYIKICKDNNVSDNVICDNLVDAGWNKKIVNKALAGNIDVPTPPENSKGSHSMWDAFEHILMFISMYIFAFSLGLLLFYFVDKAFPEISEYSYTYDDSSEFIGYLSALIVSFPLFSFFFVRITKKTITNPNIRNLLIRKLIIYGTLIIAFVTILIQIISLIYNFLDGNIDFNFVLKFLTISSITTVIFTYYLNQIKEDRKINA